MIDKPAAAAEVTDTIVSWIHGTQSDSASGIVYCLTCKVRMLLRSNIHISCRPSVVQLSSHGKARSLVMLKPSGAQA